jgi:hypothetical protein
VRIAFAIFLALHGLAHVVGFIVLWRLKEFEEMPYKTTLLSGKIDVGDRGIRIMGILWLLAALAFVNCGIVVLLAQPYWVPLTASVTGASLVFCILGWPDAKIGVFINVAIFGFLAANTRYMWIQ